MWSIHDERPPIRNPSDGNLLPYRMLGSSSADSGDLNTERQLSNDSAGGKLPYRMFDAASADITKLDDIPQPYNSQHVNNGPYSEPSSVQTQHNFVRFNDLVTPPHDMRGGSSSMPSLDNYFGFHDANWEDFDHTHIMQVTPTGGGVWNSNASQLIPSNTMAPVSDDNVTLRDNFDIEPQFLLPFNVNTSPQLQGEYHSTEPPSPNHTSNRSSSSIHTSLPSSSSRTTHQPAWGGWRSTRRPSAIANSTSSINGPSNPSIETIQMQRHCPTTSPSATTDNSSNSKVEHPTEEVVDGRTQHNLIEKKYRSRLNGRFEMLLQTIPVSMREFTARDANGAIDTRSLERNVSKAEVLVMARQYIQELEEKRNELKEDNNRLEEHIKRLERNWVNAGGLLLP